MEEKIEIGAKASEDVICSNCQKTLPGSEAHSFRDKNNNDIYMCDDCKKLIDAQFMKEVENPNYIGALLAGIIAAIVTGAVWFFIEIATEMVIGYVALGVGFVIGWAVIFGSGKKRGLGLKVISAVLTLVTIYGASYFSTIHLSNKELSNLLGKLGEKTSEYFWVSPFDPELVKTLISPMSLFIWAIGIYIAFRTPKPRGL